MDKYISFIFIGILASIFVCQTDAASAALVRERRATGAVNVMQIILKVEQLIDSCKKTDQTNSSSNSTNPIIVFFEQHDLQCLIDGAIKIYQDLNPQNRTRSKRDANSILMDLLTLEENIQKCKKSDPPATNSTNAILNFLNQYDTSCLLTTLVDFVKKLIPHNGAGSPQRTRRSLSNINWTDFGTCAALKLLGEGPTIKSIVDAFSPRRSKRDVDSKKMCADFGATMDSLLRFILDFAPNAP